MIFTDDISRYTPEQARQAAQELLDEADGGLVGPQAEEFRALVEHARARQEDDDSRRAALVRSYQAGEVRVDRGSEAYTSDSAAYVSSPVAPATQQRDGAMRTLDRSVKDGTLQARGAETVERLLQTGPAQSRSWVARWTEAAGSPDYLRAFSRLISDPEKGHLEWTGPEGDAFRAVKAVQAERAMSTTDSAGGFLIPFQLDPGIILSSGGSTNPLRQMARVVQCTGDVWNGISSDGVDAHWYAEAAEVSDDTPTLEQPSIPVHRGSAFVPFSIEIEGDGSGFVTEIGRLLADSVEQLTAAAYVIGSGNGEPTGFVTALIGTQSVVAGDGSEVIAASDPYKLQNLLPPRFQARSAWAAALPTINTFRQFETTAGALKFPALQNVPPTLLGRSVFEVSNMDAAFNTAATEANYILALGDWSQMVIADRVGTTVELVSHLFGQNRRPTGQRGFFAWFRTGSDVLVNNAFRILNVATAS